MVEPVDYVEAYHAQLLQSDQGLSYYEQLGVAQPTIQRFLLGWVDDAVVGAHEAFLHQPVIPYLPVLDGAVNAVRINAVLFDRTDGFDLGYIFGGVTPRLYNVADTIPSTSSDHVVMFDDVHSVWMTRQRGLRAIAVPGFDNFVWSWRFLLEEVDVVLAASNRWVEGAARLANRLDAWGIQTRLVGTGEWRFADDPTDELFEKFQPLG